MYCTLVRGWASSETEIKINSGSASSFFPLSLLKITWKAGGQCSLDCQFRLPCEFLFPLNFMERYSRMSLEAAMSLWGFTTDRLFLRKHFWVFEIFCLDWIKCFRGRYGCKNKERKNGIAECKSCTSQERIVCAFFWHYLSWSRSLFAHILQGSKYGLFGAVCLWITLQIFPRISCFRSTHGLFCPAYCSSLAPFCTKGNLLSLCAGGKLGPSHTCLPEVRSNPAVALHTNR